MSLDATNHEALFKYMWSLAYEIFIDTHYLEKGGVLRDAPELHRLIMWLLISRDLVSFSEQFLEVKPFTRGNSLILRKFLVELCKVQPFKNIYPKGIDFRRIPIEKLGSDISEIINEALFGVDLVTEKPISWPALPSSEININGNNFLIYQNEYFVTLRGGIIKIDKLKGVLEKYKGHVSDLKINKKDIERYLTAEPIKELVNDRLFCLDIDYLTGLRIEDELKVLREEVLRQKIAILDIPESQSGNELFKRAAKRITRLKKLVLKATAKFFEGKQPCSHHQPKYIMSMGGIASGKSHLENYKDGTGNGDTVFASVDLAREESGILELYRICNHHSDDYKSLSMFSYIVMGEVFSKSLYGRYSYFRDSTGIPYSGVNNSYVRTMKDAGFKTDALAACAPLYVMPDRKDLFDPVHERILRRLEKHNRAVPWKIVMDKNIAYPLAQMQAAHDVFLDNMTIYDTMMEKGKSCQIAKTYYLPAAQLNRLIMMENNKENLLHIMQELELLPFREDTAMQLNAEAIDFKVMARLEGYFKILVVANKTRMIDIIQKGLLNPNASGYEDLLYNSHPFHIPAIDFPDDGRDEESSYKLRLQKLS